MLQNDIGLTKTLDHIAFSPGEARLTVAHVLCEHVERRSGIRRDIVMEQRGIRSHGFHGVEDRRQHFVIDVDA